LENEKEKLFSQEIILFKDWAKKLEKFNFEKSCEKLNYENEK